MIVAIPDTNFEIEKTINQVDVSTGSYFLTLSTKAHQSFFGYVYHGNRILNALGQKAATTWQEIPLYFRKAKLDYYIIMPNHIHAIVQSDEKDIPAIVTHFMADVRTWGLNNRYEKFDWHQRIFMHHMDNQPALQCLRQYILDNPSEWDFDKDNFENILM